MWCHCGITAPPSVRPGGVLWGEKKKEMMTTAEDARKLRDWILENAGLEAKSLPIAIWIMWMMDSERWEAFRREHTPNNLEEGLELVLGYLEAAISETAAQVAGPPAEGGRPQPKEREVGASTALGPKPPAEGECLLVLPPPAEEQCLLSPSTPAEEQGLLSQCPPAEEACLLVHLLLPSQEPEGEELQAQPPEFFWGGEGQDAGVPQQPLFLLLKAARRAPAQPPQQREPAPPQPPSEWPASAPSPLPPPQSPAREAEPHQSPAREAEPHQSPAREAEQHQSPAKGGDYTLLPPPSPGDYTLLPPSSPGDHTLLPPPLLLPQEPEGEELQAQPPEIFWGGEGQDAGVPQQPLFLLLKAARRAPARPPQQWEPAPPQLPSEWPASAPSPLPPPPPSQWEDCLPLPPPPAEGEYLLVPPSPLWEDCWPLPPPPAEGEYLLVPPGAEEQELPLLPVPPPQGVQWPEPQKGELPATKKGEEVWRPLSPAALSLQEFLWPEPHRRELPATKKGEVGGPPAPAAFSLQDWTSRLSAVPLPAGTALPAMGPLKPPFPARDFVLDCWVFKGGGGR
ncbi:UNVERIFIED_CONTAM: hypothetical protein FKN15_040656 [Acipenser sinensis]